MTKENVNEGGAPALSERDVKPSVGIITALPHEYAAVEVLLESRRPLYVSGEGAGGQYVYGEIPAANGRVHSIVLALLPDMGNNIASARAAILLQHFKTVRTVIMSGIAGGVPHPAKPSEHVRLGDIVITNRQGVVQYDFDKEELEDGEVKITYRNPPRPPSASLIQTARLLQAGEMQGRRPWLQFVRRALERLSVTRPPDETDTLASSTNPDEMVPHPVDSRRVIGEPRVFSGPIASANKLLKNPIRRDQLRETFGVKAVEMEGSGIADATWIAEVQYMVIRGICDYCDKNKGEEWQNYAAVVAAAYTRALLEATPSELPESAAPDNEKKVEAALQQQSSDIISRQAQLFAKLAEVEAKVDFNIGPLSLDAPPLGAGVVLRDEAVRHFTGLFESATWCALTGGVGSGKTHLAALIAKEHGACRAWIRMRDLTPDQACVRLDQAISTLSGAPPEADWQEWCKKACAALSAGTLVVIEDIPRVPGGHLLAARLIALASACAAHGVKLLTTSAYELPQAVKGAVASGVLVTENVPVFGDAEVRELFEVYGAPADFPFDRYLGFLSALGHRHPTLLAAVARYLQSKGWVFTREEFEALVTGRFAGDQNVETQMLFVATVQDELSRNLLYRLNLANRSFTAADVRQIGEVEPHVSMPIERVNAALGLWVQRDNTDTYVLSPLLNQLGGGNLDRSTERGVHLVLGEEITRRPQLGGLDVLQVINHFTQAEAHDKAGSMLLSALVAMQDEGLAVDAWAISEIWAETPLPPGMNLDLRLAIRTSQIRTRLQLGKRIEFALNDLDALLGQATDANAFSVMGATLLVAPVLLERGDLGRGRHYLVRALRAKELASLPDGGRFEFPPEVTPESLIWADLGKIDSRAKLLEWWDTFEQFTPEQIQTASQGMIAEYGSMIIADRLVELEARKAPTCHDWDAVLGSLESFSERARRLGFELLWACTVSARINVLAKFKNDFERALRLAGDALDAASEDPRVGFVIRESVGQRLVRAERWEEGLKWLHKALASPTEAFAVDRMHALLIASQATGVADPEEALRLTEQAVELAKTSDEIPETDVVKALGEQAIATWLTGNLAGALAPLAEAGERLFACKADVPVWKALLVTYGHVVGYLSYLHTFGAPPRPNGGEMPAPVRNLFLFEQPDALAQYDESKDCLVVNSLANFAINVGDHELGSRLSLRAFDMARETGTPQSRLVVAPFALAHIVLADRYEDAIDAALDIGKTIVATEIEKASGRVVDARFDPDAALGAKPSERWDKAEAKAAMHGLVPIMFRLGAIKLTDEAQALAGAQLVARVCREVASKASSAELWISAAELFESVFTGEASAEELRLKGKDHAHEVPPVLHTLCYIAISVLGTVQQAAGSQLAVLPYLSEVFDSRSMIHTQIIVPFIRSYWLRSISESRFSFRTPALVEEALSHVVSAPAEVSAQQILDTVATGVGVVPTEKARAWLNTGREAARGSSG
jgi:nucleoside phosphorylase